jgi:hypothetical protein
MMESLWRRSIMACDSVDPVDIVRRMDGKVGRWDPSIGQQEDL